MNLIIEGSECNFKTTIANKLSKKLNMPIKKGSSFELATGSNADLYSYFLEVSNLKNTIIDRSIYSNLVYAPLYEGYAMITPEQYIILENRLKKNSIVVYLTSPVDTIVQRIKERGDEYIRADYEELDKISKKYTEVFSKAVKNGVKVYTFDTSVLSSDEITSQLLELFSHKIHSEDVKSEYIHCIECGKEVLRKNAQFTEKCCVTCYEKIFYDILDINN